jgi:integrase-like protein
MVSGGDWRNPDLGHVEWSGKTPWKSQGTAIASGPKLGSHAYWESTKAKVGSDPTPRPRSEPPAQGAAAGPKAGSALPRGIQERISPHWLRHAHASHALVDKAPISLVQQTLGDGSLKTTSTYAHARPGDSSALYLKQVR